VRAIGHIHFAIKIFLEVLRHAVLADVSDDAYHRPPLI
jgi:hypothetical protein